MPIFDPKLLSIRPAELPDLDACLAFDPTYSTDFVWQMESQNSSGQIGVTFRSVRLPRAMRVAYPRDSRQLAWNWQRCEGFLVAEVKGQIVGYVALTVHKDQAIAGITDLVVERYHRQQGVGAALLKAAIEWSREHGLKQLIAELQTKNYPAICFYQKMGFVFCGFNDHYYANRDIALFFALGLR